MTQKTIVYNIKRNDTLPVLGIDVLNYDGDAYDFGDATDATFSMYTDAEPRVVKIDNEAAVITPPGTQGQLQYTFDTSGTDTAGKFLGEFTVNFSTGDTATFPTVGFIQISVEEDLDDA